MPGIIQAFRKGRRVNPLLNGLVEWWNLNESTGPRYGSYAGIIFSSINNVSSAAGIGNTTAASFSAASSQELNTPSSSALQMGDYDFSMLGWIYMASNNYGSMLNKWQDSDLEYILYYDPSITSFRFILNSGSAVHNVASTTFGSASLNTWYMVYGEYDATADLMKISVNAGALDSTSHAGGAAALSSPLVIGRVDTANFQNARVQRCGIWKRKLTATEVSSIYNGGAGRSYPLLS